MCMCNNFIGGHNRTKRSPLCVFRVFSCVFISCDKKFPQISFLSRVVCGIFLNFHFYPGYPGRKRIYPPGLMINNIPRILFSSQSCHNYDSTPGTRVEIKLSPLEKVCLGLDLSLFDFLKTKITKKTSKEPLQPLQRILESDVRSSTFLCNVFHPISCRLSTLSIIS